MLPGEEINKLQKDIIPKLCTLYEDAIKIFDNFKDTKVIDKTFMKRYFEEGEIEWDDFTFTKKVLPNNAIEYIYDFGEPPRFPLCRFAIFYADVAQNIFKYITLEKTLFGNKCPYIVCGVKGEKHVNYMTECPGDLEAFEGIVKEIVEKKIEPISLK